MSKSKKFHPSKEERFNKKESIRRQRRREEKHELPTSEWQQEDISPLPTSEEATEVPMVRDSSRR